MFTPRRLAPVAILLLSALSADPLAGAQTRVPSRPGVQVTPPRDVSEASEEASTGHLGGRVFSAEGGAPLRRAQIRVSSAGSRQGRVTSSDADGRWAIDELPAGRYTVTAGKAGFVTLRFGQRRPFEPGRPIELSAGQAFNRADFALPRGSVITGNVLDEFGEPVAEAVVGLLRYRWISGERRLMPVGRLDRTDDRGAFRLYGVEPGDYYVTATLVAGFRRGQEESEDRTSYAPTYYPGTPNLVEAQRLTVGLGEELAAGTIGMVPVRSARVSGTAVNSRGMPLSGAQVFLRSDSQFQRFGRGGTRAQADGTFEIGNVAPGDYILQVGTGQRTEGAEFASLPISVQGDDVGGLYLSTRPGTSVSGRIAFDPGVAPTFESSSLRVDLQSIEAMTPFPGRRSRTPLEEDWSFELRNMVQPSRLQLTGLPPDWAVKAVLFNGTDVTDTPFDPRATDRVEGVEILLTDRVTEVSGSVSDARDQMVTDCTVIFFARDRTRWGARSRFIASARPDQEGRYQVTRLPPAEYLAAAVDVVEQGEWQDPELLERLLPIAQPVRLDDGGRVVLDLSLSRRPS